MASRGLAGTTWICVLQLPLPRLQFKIPYISCHGQETSGPELRGGSPICETPWVGACEPRAVHFRCGSDHWGLDPTWGASTGPGCVWWLRWGQLEEGRGNPELWASRKEAPGLRLVGTVGTVCINIQLKERCCSSWT